MKSDIVVLLWKEWRERFTEMGRPLNALQTMALVMVGSGVWFAIREADAFAAMGPVTSAIAGAVLVTLTVSDSFAGERERRTLEALTSTPLSGASIFIGKVLAAAAHGWILGFLFGLTGATVLILRGGDELGPVWQPLAVAGAVVFGIAAALLSAAVGCAISIRSPTIAAAQQRLFATLLTFLMVVTSLLLGPALLVRRLGTDGGSLVQVVAQVLAWVRMLTPAEALLWAAAGCLLLASPAVAVGLSTVRRERSEPSPSSLERPRVP